MIRLSLWQNFCKMSLYLQWYRGIGRYKDLFASTPPDEYAEDEFKLEERESWDKLIDFYKTQDGCDVSLLVGPEKVELKAHKIILSLSSNYFHAMFSRKWNLEYNKEQIELPFPDVETMKAVLDFIYKIGITFEPEEAYKIAIAASYFEIPGLLQKCTRMCIRNTTSENAVDTLVFADEYQLLEMRSKLQRYVARRLEDMSKDINFFRVSAACMHQIAALPEAVVIDNDPARNERELFIMLMHKVSSMHGDELEAIVCHILRSVRLPVMDKEYLRNIENKLSDMPKAKQLVKQAICEKSLTPYPATAGLESAFTWSSTRFRQEFTLKIKSKKSVLRRVPGQKVQTSTMYLDGNAFILKCGIISGNIFAQLTYKYHRVKKANFTCQNIDRPIGDFGPATVYVGRREKAESTKTLELVVPPAYLVKENDTFQFTVTGESV